MLWPCRLVIVQICATTAYCFLNLYKLPYDVRLLTQNRKLHHIKVPGLSSFSGDSIGNKVKLRRARLYLVITMASLPSSKPLSLAIPPWIGAMSAGEDSVSVIVWEETVSFV